VRVWRGVAPTIRRIHLQFLRAVVAEKVRFVKGHCLQIRQELFCEIIRRNIVPLAVMPMQRNRPGSGWIRLSTLYPHFSTLQLQVEPELSSGTVVRRAFAAVA